MISVTALSILLFVRLLAVDGGGVDGSEYPAPHPLLLPQSSDIPLTQQGELSLKGSRGSDVLTGRANAMA